MTHDERVASGPAEGLCSREEVFMRHVTRRQVLVTASLGGALVAALQPASVEADQPYMQAALDALFAAKKNLEEAAADKGGHREKAIRLIKNAITEVERGIEYYRRHVQ